MLRLRFCAMIILTLAALPSFGFAAPARNHEFDPQGRLTSFTNSEGLHVRVEHEFDGSQVFWNGARLIGIQRPNGTKIEHAYDDRGNLTATRVTDGSRRPRMLHYKPGQVLSVASRGVVAKIGSWTFVYDHLCRIREVIKPDGRRFRASEDLDTGDVRLYVNKRVVDVLKEDGTFISYVYGSQGTVAQMRITRPGRDPEYRDFDEAGRVALVTIGKTRHPELADPAAGKPQLPRPAQPARAPTAASALPPSPAVSTPATARSHGPTAAQGDGRQAGQRSAHAGPVYGRVASAPPSVQPLRAVHALASAPLMQRSPSAMAMPAVAAAAASAVLDPQPYGFAGEPRDPVTGFSCNRARWYQPATGRFPSPDPLAGEPFEPATLHKYTYAGHDPVNRTDPTGQFFLSTSFASFGMLNTVYAMTAPIPSSMLRHASLDLVPILLKSKNWSGWLHEDVHVQLLTAKHYWEKKLEMEGYHVNVRTEIGPVEDQVVVRDAPFFAGDLTGIVSRNYRSNWPLHTLPVAFLAGIGGRNVSGATFTTDPRQMAAIALRHDWLTGAPPERTLAHEIGHTLGLGNVYLPWRLMNDAGPVGTVLTQSERDAARRGFEIRNGK